MQKLFIEKTKSTPEINFSPSENIFMIRGTSSPEDVRAMYYPVIEWIKTFVDDVQAGGYKVFNIDNPITFQLDLSYFNSSSAKFFFDLLKEMQRLSVSDTPFKILWFYDPGDPDMKEAGIDFAEMVGLDFIFLPKPKDS